MLVAAVVVVVGVILVAMGRGGEMARPGPDMRPLDTDIVTAADVALLRPPTALWGYDMRATDEALNKVARTVTERDVEIATLRRQLAEMRAAAAVARDGERGRFGEPGRSGDPATAGERGPAGELRRARGPGMAGEPGPAAEPGLAREPRTSVEPGPTGNPGQKGEPGRFGEPGTAAPGPSALPLRRDVSSPARPSAGTQSWSAWERPGPAGPSDKPDNGERPETGPGGGVPGRNVPGRPPGTNAPGHAPEESE